MSQNASIWLLILLALVGANLPFVSQRLLAVLPLPRGSKNLGWRLLELLVCYGVVIAIGMAIERAQGQNQPQGWEFYAVTAALFLTFAFPGFVWRYMLRRSAR